MINVTFGAEVDVTLETGRWFEVDAERWPGQASPSPQLPQVPPNRGRERSPGHAPSWSRFPTLQSRAEPLLTARVLPGHAPSGARAPPCPLLPGAPHGSRCRAAITLPVPELTCCPCCTLSPCAWCPPALPAISAGTRGANRLALVPPLLLGSLDSILGALHVAEGAGRSYFLRLSHLYVCA